MGRRAYVLDGITGAILKQCRLPKPCSHMAYSPPRLGPPKLVAIFCDGSLWSLEGFDPTEAARGGGIGDGATRFRRLHAPTVKDKRLALRRNARGTMAFCASPNGPGAEPLCIFAVVGEKELRFATIRRPGGGNDGASSGGFADISPAVSPTSPLSNASDRTSDRTSAAHEPPVKLRGEPKKTPIAFVCSHPDLSPRICAGYVDGTVRVYDLATCAVAAAFKIPPPIGAKRGTAAPTCAVCVRLPPARHHHGGGGHHGWEGGGHGAGGGTVGEAAVASSFVFLSLVLSQRQKELAVLQAIGASPNQIIRLVLFEILSIVMVSMVLGIVLGVGLALSFNGFFDIFGFIFQIFGGSTTTIQRTLVYPWAQIILVSLAVFAAVVVALLVTTRRALKADLASVLKGE